VIFDVIPVDVVIFEDDTLAPQGWVPNIPVDVHELPMSILAADEMRIGQSENVGQ
jgi:hypothetical protein